MAGAGKGKKYQIFLSSTYSDLREEREAAFQTIADLLHIPLGMERFVASDGDKLRYIKRQIDQADYLIVILGVRYGAKDPVSGESYTELEFDYATSNGIPTLAFVMSDAARSARIAADPGLISGDDNLALEKFRARLQDRSIVRIWNDKNELALHCQRSLINLFDDNPRPGWVRYDEANEFAEEKVRDISLELSLSKVEGGRLQQNNDELSAQVRDLKEKLGQFQAISERVSADSILGRLRILARDLNDADTDEQRHVRMQFETLLSRFEDLVKASENAPELVSSATIEYVGDICRNNNLMGLALWFYERAMMRDPDRISGKVEYYCLLAEMVPQRRLEAISKIKDIIFDAEEGQVARIFNALIETGQFKDLEDLATALLDAVGQNGAPSKRAFLLRNRAVARNKRGKFTGASDSLSDMAEALQLAPNDEGILSPYAAFLLESRQWLEAARKFKELINIDPNDIKYYIGLAQSLHMLRRPDDVASVLEAASRRVRSVEDRALLVMALEQMARAGEPEFDITL